MLTWLRSHLAPRVQPIDPPPPWDGDLVGEDRLRVIEQRRATISETVQHFREDVDASLRDEVRAMQQEREHGG